MDYIIQRPDQVLDVVTEHIYITVVTVLLASVMGVILGVLITRIRALYDPILTVAGVIYTVPSLAMFVLMIPLLGIGFNSAVVALVLYSLLVLIRNTAVGIDSIDPNVIEAARGMGMTSLGILFRIELPLALPIVFAGIRIATVSAISLGTIAAFIGAGGIGDLIFQGISSQRDDKIVAGAVAASVMALAAEFLLRQVERGSAPGITGEFKTMGEYVADFWHFLREKPDVVTLVGALLLLFSYVGLTWVEPYSTDEAIAGDETAQAILDDANLLQMTGWDLAQIKTNAPIRESLRILPWTAIIAGVVALWNITRTSRRASAEILLLCGLLALFPLLHFHFELRRAVGDLGTASGLFRDVRSNINALISGRVPIRPETLEAESGFTVAWIGAGLIVAGAYLKSLWFRQQTQKERQPS